MGTGTNASTEYGEQSTKPQGKARPGKGGLFCRAKKAGNDDDELKNQEQGSLHALDGRRLNTKSCWRLKRPVRALLQRVVRVRKRPRERESR